jgi:DNA-binding Xre family transcriptional regulator
MLSIILKSEINERNISVREASRQINIAHTTLIRIIEGEVVDLKTIKKVSEWLGINVSDVLKSDTSNEKGIGETLAMFLDRNPKLRDAFIGSISKLQTGEIKKNVIEDILAYIAFRLSINNV